MKINFVKPNNMKAFKILSLACFGSIVLTSCMKESSSSTGWEYNSVENGGFEKAPFEEQETGPGLVFIEGGTFVMGRSEQDVMYDWNNRAARVTVSSFYMDQTEVTNFHWLEYLYWLNRTFSSDPDGDEGFFPMVYQNALPDTLCWRTPLGFHEKFVEYYLRHPAYRDYPVVGVSWLQANDYCKWRTDRVNEKILIREGVLKHAQRGIKGAFNTEVYLAGEMFIDGNGETGDAEFYFPKPEYYANEKKGGKPAPEKNEKFHFGKVDLGKSKNEKIVARNIKMEDGLLLPRYRLPTEAEWEFAASGLIGNLEEGSENIDARRFYPWDGHWVRDENDQFKGSILANFVRGRGDYMGVAGMLNDGADVTAPVESYWPNDYGLYNMAGNVSEWVLDVYRPLSSEDFDEFRPYRGNVFTTKELTLTSQGFKYAGTNMNNISYDVHGMKEFLNEFERIRFQRISGANHDPHGKSRYTSNNDTVRMKGMAGQVASRNPVQPGYSPDNYYLSHDLKKDTIELKLIKVLNNYVDSAIAFKNDKRFEEADAVIVSMLKILTSDNSAVWIKEEIITDKKAYESYQSDAPAMILDGIRDYVDDTPGKLRYRNVTDEENIGRLNYRKDDYIDYKDGDIESSTYYNDSERKNKINAGERSEDLVMYQYQHENYSLTGDLMTPYGDSIKGRNGWPTTMISDKSRVYKGGSWADRAYWLVVGNRRYLDERLSMATLGFRCCMDRIGSPHGNNYQGGSGNIWSGITRRRR
jgi:gliding motility-associated lipoprotein GldJ